MRLCFRSNEVGCYWMTAEWLKIAVNNKGTIKDIILIRIWLSTIHSGDST